MPLNYAEDEDELQDVVGALPDDSVSNGPPLQDFSIEGMIEKNRAPASAVPSYIAKRRGMAPPPSSPGGDMMSDPLMKQYEGQQQELDRVRQNQMEASRIAGMGQAFSQAARGASAPVENDSLFKNMQAQQGQILKSKEEDMDRRQKILASIEARRGHESIARASQNQRNQNRGVQINRLLGQTEKELREDPIAKPSEMSLASLGKSKMILENRNVPLTSQMLSDAEQDVASALTLRGQGATEGKIQRTELVTMGRKLAEAKQKYLNKIVDLRQAEPELVGQLMKMNQALIDDYKTTVADRKHSILDDKEAIWGDDDVFSKKLGALRQSISKRYGDRPADKTMIAEERGAPVPPRPTQDSGGFFSSAHAGGGDSGPYGASVVQNGVTFVWNGSKYVPGGQ